MMMRFSRWLGRRWGMAKAISHTIKYRTQMEDLFDHLRRESYAVKDAPGQPTVYARADDEFVILLAMFDRGVNLCVALVEMTPDRPAPRQKNQTIKWEQFSGPNLEVAITAAKAQLTLESAGNVSIH